MLNDLNLVADTMWEQYGLMKDHITHDFWDFVTHDPVPNSVYVVGRKQVTDNLDKFRSMANDERFVMIFANSAEGSATLRGQLSKLGLLDQVLSGRILVISGGDLEPAIPYLLHEHFLIRILDFEENHVAMQRTPDIFQRRNKPWDFLFLNGRVRAHRKYLWERFRQEGLLDRSMWTMLDGHMAGSKLFRLYEQGRDIMDTHTPIRRLPVQYEVARYRNTSTDHMDRNSYIKADMFGGEWGEVYLEPTVYIDTYFSVVTETVVDYDHSFRTEKIAKVLCMGHPWICAANKGFYRDMHRMGFKTFGHVIDESFDEIDDPVTRMERVVSCVRDLCQQDLDSFLDACQETCKYNQEHLRESVLGFRRDFPEQFRAFVGKYRT